MANSIVKFDEHGDGLARYTIFNYQRKTSGKGYDYKVGFLFLMKSLNEHSPERDPILPLSYARNEEYFQVLLIFIIKLRED